MSGEVLGSIFNQNGYSTARMRAVWSDENLLKTVCQVETAVAYAMSKNKKIPLSAYEEIKEKVVPENYDLTKLRLAAARSGHFLAGFVSYSQQLFDDGAGQYLHYGAASEDVEDTCYVLQLKQADKILMDYLVKFGSVLYDLADRYKKTISVAIAHRTYSSPSTLGFKLGIILNELTRCASYEILVSNGQVLTRFCQRRVVHELESCATVTALLSGFPNRTWFEFPGVQSGPLYLNY